MKYIEPLFRPPAETDSLIFQVAYGCPWNRCRFCGMYKGVSYRRREMAEVLAEVRLAGRRYPKTRRIFLADGDVMRLPYDNLREILEACRQAFPRLARVNVYANASSILAKNPEQLRGLRGLGLNTLYLGLESGDEELLQLVDKEDSVSDMVEAVRLAQENGLRCSVMVLLGLGGKKNSDRHVAETTRAVNAMKPRLLSALRFIEVPGAKMFDGYDTVSEALSVRELRGLVAGFDLDRTVFAANHASIPFPVQGRLPADRDKLLELLDEILASGRLDEHGPGRTPFWL